MKNSIAIRNWKSLGFCLALFAGLFIVSCESDDSPPPDSTVAARVPYVCTSCPTASEALPGNDEVDKGIYKGVFSTGALAINFRNNDEKVTGKLFYRGRTIDLFEETGSTSGKPSNTLLKGFFDGKEASLRFSVDENGGVPEVSDFSIDGERSVMPVMVFKEKSKMLIESYEGNYFLATNVNSSGGSDEVSERTDPGLELPPQSATAVGGVRLVLSRTESMWMLFKTMNAIDGSVMDHGSISDGTLISDVSGRRVAYLRGDELNNNESVSSGLLYLHAERKR